MAGWYDTHMAMYYQNYGISPCHVFTATPWYDTHMAGWYVGVMWNTKTMEHQNFVLPTRLVSYHPAVWVSYHPTMCCKHKSTLYDTKSLWNTKSLYYSFGITKTLYYQNYRIPKLCITKTMKYQNFVISPIHVGVISLFWYSIVMVIQSFGIP